MKILPDGVSYSPKPSSFKPSWRESQASHNSRTGIDNIQLCFAISRDKVVGKTSLNVPGFVSLEIRQPYGVTAGIIPWLVLYQLDTVQFKVDGNPIIRNSPMITLAWKIAPART